jgi:hypothetical protein
MAVNKAWCTGTSALMDWFNDNAEQPYYSVWRGRNLSFSWNNDDLEAGRAKLQNDINFAEQNNVSEVLTIKLHPRKDKGFITDKTPTYASLDFRPAALETPAMYGVQVSGQSNYQMERILEKLNTLESRISANEAMGELEDYVDDAPQSPINAMLSNPEVQQALVSGVLGLLGGLVNQPNSALAGVIDGANDEAIQLLEQLMNKGVTVDHLRKLAQMSESKLKGLLIML